MRSLLIGCGRSRTRKVTLPHPHPQQWDKLITLDMTHEVSPSVVCNLEQVELPFKDSCFDEIHAYEVLEHIGRQGDWKFLLREFDEFARVLKPKGLFYLTSPKYDSPWLWGDPGHTRYIGIEPLTFLNRAEYERQQGQTAMTDYRPYFKSDWRLSYKFTGDTHSNVVILMSVK